MQFKKTLFWNLLEFPKNILPRAFRIFADPETFYIEKMLNEIPTAKGGCLALDCGAGTQKQKFFVTSKGYKYESSDFEDIFDSSSKAKQTYICDVEDMPMDSNRYDLIISVQVLEHVIHPRESVREMARVLKPGGKLFLSTNFLYQRHGEPYDFYRFTEDGLRSISSESGLELLKIESHGGFFSMISQFFHELPLNFRNFIIFGTTHPKSWQHPIRSRLPILIVLLLPIFLSNLITQILAFFFHALDRFDRIKRYTLGYSLILTKLERDR